MRKGRTIQQRYGTQKKSGLGLKKKVAILSVGFFLFIAAAAAGIFILYKGLGRSDFFQITATKIQGCRRTTKNLILELSGVDVHSNLVALDMKRVRDSIESHEWVEAVEIEREWPNHLIITVKERSPVAIASLGEGLFYVDRHGVAFAQVLPPEEMDYPVISGLDRESWPKEVKGTSLADALDFLKYAGRGSTILPLQNVSEIHLQGEEELTLFLVDRPFAIHLGRGNIRTKYYRLAKVLYRLYKRKEFDNTAYIRMDYTPNKVLVGFSGAG